MERKKIFITIPYFLPANPAGETVKFVSGFINEFEEEIDYFIICQDIDTNGAELENIIANEWVDYNNHCKVWYTKPEKVSDTIVKQVEIIKPDLLFIVGFFSWHFNMVPLLFCKGPQKIISTNGLLYPQNHKQNKWGRKVFLSIFKLLEYHYKVDFQVTNEDERNFIVDYFNNVPNVFITEIFENTEKIKAQYLQMFRLSTDEKK